MGSVTWGEAVGEDEIALRGVEGLEFEIGDDAEGGAGASEGPEEVGVG